jgi:hypothetical protein
MFLILAITQRGITCDLEKRLPPHLRCRDNPVLLGGEFDCFRCACTALSDLGAEFHGG